MTNLPERLACYIFAIGDEPGDCTQRIQFKGGEWPSETDLGGLNKESLARVIRKFFLEEYND